MATGVSGGNVGLPLRHNEGCPAPQRLRDELHSVALKARHRYKSRPRLHEPGVIDDRRYSVTRQAAGNSGPEYFFQPLNIQAHTG